MNKLIVRLRKELNSIDKVLKDLSTRIFKLKKFILTEKFMDLSLEMRFLLKEQLKYMEEGLINIFQYYNVLNQRYKIIIEKGADDVFARTTS